MPPSPPSLPKNVTSKPQLLKFIFQPHAKPINCTTFSSTKLIASDPSHPYHIRTKRRLAAFDPQKLHWAVKCPVELSKKAVVRNWAIRRVREGFKAALKDRGWSPAGEALATNDNEGIFEKKGNLKGALAILLDKDKSVVKASGEDVRRQCDWVLRKVIDLQDEGGSERDRVRARNGPQSKKYGRKTGDYSNGGKDDR